MSPAITVHTLRKKREIRKQCQSSQYFLVPWSLDKALIGKMVEVGKILFGVDCWNGCTQREGGAKLLRYRGSGNCEDDFVNK